MAKTVNLLSQWERGKIFLFVCFLRICSPVVRNGTGLCLSVSLSQTGLCKVDFASPSELLTFALLQGPRFEVAGEGGQMGKR